MIRKALIDDAREIANIKVEGWKNAYKGIISQYYLSNMDKEKEAENISKLIAKENNELNGEYYVYIADNVSMILGFSFVNTVKNKELETDAEVVALYVKNGYTRMGIGAEILNFLKDELRKINAKNILIWCLEDNISGRNFYEKNNGVLVSEKSEQIGTQILNFVGYKFKI